MHFIEIALNHLNLQTLEKDGIFNRKKSLKKPLTIQLSAVDTPLVKNNSFYYKNNEVFNLLHDAKRETACFQMRKCFMDVPLVNRRDIYLFLLAFSYMYITPLIIYNSIQHSLFNEPQLRLIFSLKKTHKGSTQPIFSENFHDM